MGGHLNDLCCGLDVGTSQDSILGACEGLVLHELEATAMINKSVTGNAGLLVIGLCKTTVDDHQLTSRLDRILAGTDLHGHMTVDNMPVRASDTEGIHDLLANLLIVAQLEVVALMFGMGLLVFYEIALESSHL